MQNDEKQSLLGLQAASPFVSFRKKVVVLITTILIILLFVGIKLLPCLVNFSVFKKA